MLKTEIEIGMNLPKELFGGKSLFQVFINLIYFILFDLILFYIITPPMFRDDDDDKNYSLLTTFSQETKARDEDHMM